MLGGTVVAAAVCCAVATEALLLGSPRGRWHYPYVQPLALTPFLAAFGVSVPVLALLRIRARSAAGEWSLIVAWIALATAAHAALRALTPFSFESIFTSPGANAFYTVTLQRPLSAVLSSFVQARDAMPLHAQSNMPGKLVLMYGLEMVTVSPAVLPWIMVILSNLGALLMYRFVRQLVEDHATALYSAVLYLFVPAKLFFFPLMNTITPVIALALACLIVEWLKTARLAWAVAIGERARAAEPECEGASDQDRLARSEAEKEFDQVGAHPDVIGSLFDRVELQRVCPHCPEPVDQIESPDHLHNHRTDDECGQRCDAVQRQSRPAEIAVTYCP